MSKTDQQWPPESDQRKEAPEQKEEPARKPGLSFDSGVEILQTAYIDAGMIEAYGRLKLIYGFSRALCGETEISKIPDTALEALVRLVNLERCFIARLDEQGELRPLVTHNIELAQDAAQWPVSKTIIKRVMQDGLPILSADTMQDNQFAARQSIHLNRIRTVICAPLGLKGECIGIIYADSRRTADKFSQADLHFLIALSHYLYLAIRSNEHRRRRTAQVETQPDLLALPEELASQHNIITRAKPVLAAYHRLRRVANKDLPLMIVGETGTGKELFARAAHKLSHRADQPFVALNIAALSETLVESELFGHEKGAFSGANYTRAGKFELANGGTLFLDEVAEIPLNIQAKLLRVLETGDFERVGGAKLLHSDIRIICATNKNLAEAVDKGQFREDLYYRLKGVIIPLPALRDHSEDIPEIAEYMLQRINSPKQFSEKAMRALIKYQWPGNVRQLLRLVEELDAIIDTDQIELSDLPDYLTNQNNPTNITHLSNKNDSTFLPLNDLIAKIECDYIQRAIELANGNNDRAIEMLGISRAKFFDRKKAYGL